MKSRGANYRDLVPIYVAGRLSPEQREALEEALEIDPELRKEVDEFLVLREGYKDLEQDLPLPSNSVLERVRVNIKKDRVSKRKGSLVHALIDSFGSLFSMPKLAWSVAAVQLILILFLVSGTFQEAEYQTLSSDTATMENVFQIYVVFEAEAMERDIRALLQGIGLRIKDGPDAGGLYVLEGADGHKAQEALAMLQSSGIVRFAQTPY